MKSRPRLDLVVALVVPTLTQGFRACNVRAANGLAEFGLGGALVGNLLIKIGIVDTWSTMEHLEYDLGARRKNR